MNDRARFDRIIEELDAPARAGLCVRLGVARGGSLGEEQARIADALDGSMKQLFELVERDDLIAMLRHWVAGWSDHACHVVGLRDAGVDELHRAVVELVGEEWRPRRGATRIPGSALELCWFAPGEDHAVEFEDDDGPADGVHDLLDEAIYTIVHPSVIDGHEREGITLEEGRPWVAGLKLRERAHRDHRRLVVVLADATATRRILGWTYVRSLVVDKGTSCRTGPVVRLRRPRLFSIRKLSDGQPLDLGYIRPYVPCHLPSFVVRTVPRMRALEGDHVAVPARSPRSDEAQRPSRLEPPSSRDPAGPVLAFSWGYHGWGNHTVDLVRTVDEIESSRGFAPPLFVDVRLSRSVRAAGFREKAFERQLNDRYMWMKGLGNRAIADASLDRAVLEDPSQAQALLELIVERAARRQRVIFFCSCPSPLARSSCHRGLVAKTILAAAKRRKVSLTVHEWPGGSPQVSKLDVSPELMRRMQSIKDETIAALQVPVPSAVTPAMAAALPHLSILRLRCGADELIGASAAAVMTARGWRFPILDLWEPDALDEIQGALDRHLVKDKLAPLGAELALPPRWRTEDLG